MTLAMAFIINSLLVASAVMVHYGFLFKIARVLPGLKVAHSLKIVFGVFGALIAHVIEIWIFAFAYHFMIRGDAWGRLEGNFNGSIFDCVYFSFTVYTTVGFGDIEPIGYVRYLTGVESLTGLVLITWTASFLYLQMQKNWERI